MERRPSLNPGRRLCLCSGHRARGLRGRLSVGAVAFAFAVIS
jgi:hypothetical protein